LPDLRQSQAGAKECDRVTIGFETDDDHYQLLAEKLALIFGDALVII
jgi:hypothetical protein